MADHLTQVVEVLMWHPSIEAHEGRFDWCCPTCDIALNGGPNSPACAAHQADMLASAGLLTETLPQWGAVDRDGRVRWIEPTREATVAHMRAAILTIDRLVTRTIYEPSAWRPADEEAVHA